MGKSGTMDDASDERLRKTRARDRVRLGLTTAATSLGPTCLIVCPTSLLDNVRADWLDLNTRVADIRLPLTVEA